MESFTVLQNRITNRRAYEDAVDAYVAGALTAPDQTEWDRLFALPQHITPEDPDADSANPAWLHAKRSAVLSGSRVANAIGEGFHNVDKSLVEWIWPEFTNMPTAYLKWGNKHEHKASEALSAVLQARVDDPEDDLIRFENRDDVGIAIFRKHPQCGYSADGVVERWYSDGTSDCVLAEFKCPASKKKRESTSGDMYSRMQVPRAYGRRRNPSTAPRQSLPIPKYYYSQVQWGMGILLREGVLRRRSPAHNLECHFLVWNPQRHQHCLVPYDGGFFKDFMLPTALDFWRNRFVPAFVARQVGGLTPKTTDLVFDEMDLEQGEAHEAEAHEAPPEAPPEPPEEAPQKRVRRA